MTPTHAMRVRVMQLLSWSSVVDSEPGVRVEEMQ